MALQYHDQSSSVALPTRNDVRMLVICPHLRWYVWIGEDGEITAGLRSDSGALNVLIVAETNVDGRVTHSLEQLRARVLVEHPFAERTELLPLVSAALWMAST